MYESFFGLEAAPFRSEPDPKCYYRIASHNEAYSRLTNGIAERQGLMTLLGEVGTGKTILVNSILSSRDPASITVLIKDAAVGREELLRKVLLELYASRGLRSEDDPTSEKRTSSIVSRLARLSRVELINEVSGCVMDEFSIHRPPPVFVIDEAQKLSIDALEEVRLLTNLEDSKKRVIQLILAGQPELEVKLARADLEHLRRRIAVSVRLERLSLAETADYIRFRLAAVGASTEALFTSGAVEIIWSAAKGLPRTINILCDKSLVVAFAAGASEVDGIAAREAVRDINSPRYREVAAKKPETYLLTGRTSFGREKEEKPSPANKDHHRSRAG